METIEFNGKEYPKLQSEGFASQYCFPFAEKMCKGIGFDIGYSLPEWKFPGSIGIDDGRVIPQRMQNVDFKSDYSAMNLPDEIVDYIFSSHCLEHLPDWVGVLDYWTSKLRSGGVMFLYLPNADYQEYWRPMHNRKHLNWLTPNMLESYYLSRGFKNIFVTQGYDLNGSFYAVAEKV
jgi:SAM-dependent methyltransferase